MRTLLLAIWLVAPGIAIAERGPAYPSSPVISSVWFELNSMIELAPGSDNWPVTWAADGHQYTSWGDGGGFGGTNIDGRVSFGVGRIEGGAEDYSCTNLWGGVGLPRPAYGGKSYGILALEDTLWLWRGGDASNASLFEFRELYRSTDKGASWQAAGVRFDRDEFSDTLGVFALTFCQFGRGYQGARDNYIYIYAPRTVNLVWDVQVPGEVLLLRVPRGEIGSKEAYRWFAGTEQSGEPRWSADYDSAQPVFSDQSNGVMRTSVTFNAGLGRYLLSTQQVSRNRDQDGYLGIYDAPEPWGPWTTVLFASAFEPGVVDFAKTVFFNFSNKWTSPDGRKSVLVYTNKDNWATLESEFFMSGECVKVGHRGSAGHFPENTLASFAGALEQGVDMVELDVHLCSDGQVVVIHDDSVDRTTDSEGKVGEMTLRALQKLDAGGGEKIPTLAEVLLLIGSRCSVNVELKGPGTAAPVADILRRFVIGKGIPWDNFMVSSFDHEQLAELKNIEPRVRRAPLFGKELPEDYLETAHTLGAWSLNLNAETVTAELVSRCHREGLLVQVYTVNEPDEIARMKELGVDGIISDYPDKL